ncbi:hypothetical protein SBA4_430003 [Candidatus Sulfopaludibacter sp. SbA4]|nr:hypothetical protein SBA4_430003 [Candidatus Sulfopaludibacter sp. SbA4]
MPAPRLRARLQPRSHNAGVSPWTVFRAATTLSVNGVASSLKAQLKGQGSIENKRAVAQYFRP